MNLFTENIIDINTTGGYTLEQVLNNKNCSKEPKYWYVIKNTMDLDEPRYLFKSACAESWEFFDKDIENPVRNTNQIYLRFKDVSKFVAPSNYYREYGEYPYSGIPNTIQWNKYWDGLEEKIENGFEVDGVRITGRHFFMINFGRFKAIPVDKYGNATSTRKIWTFLRFVDHQYYMMHELDECFLEGIYHKDNKINYLRWFPNKTENDFLSLKLTNFATSKGRRKGWTAAIGIGCFSYNFTFKESSMNIIAAYEKGKYKPILDAVHDTKSFLDGNTPWVRRTDIKGTRDHFISGVEMTNEYGIKTREGYKSEVQALSFKDNIFKGIGASADLINIEEAGIFQHLIESYKVSMEPLIRDGETMIGTCIVGGTAGDIESGASEGLREIMNKPSDYGFKAYDNIYEEQVTNAESGWFIDDLWYSPITKTKTEFLKIDSSERTKEILDGFDTELIETVDIYGNSYRYLSNLILEDKRRRQRGQSSLAYQKFITQQPKYLSEAFLMNEASPFDTATAKEVLGHLAVEKIRMKKGTFALTQGKPRFQINMDLVAIEDYKFTGHDTTGCWVIYEDPIRVNGEIPVWRYLAGNDPIDYGTEESSSSGTHSMAAAYIIDSISRNIVAEYVGRPAKADDYFEQLWRGIEYYNGILLYENNLKSLFSYFKLRNKLHLLANEPESLKGRFGYKSNNRIKGFHATAASNSYARELIHTWTLEEVVVGQDNEDGQVSYAPRMYYIKSRGLLQEIIYWNSKGNFDRISGLGAAMILLFDRTWDEDDSVSTESVMNTGIFKKMKDLINIGDKFNFINR